MLEIEQEQVIRSGHCVKCSMHACMLDVSIAAKMPLLPPKHRAVMTIMYHKDVNSDPTNKDHVLNLMWVGG